MTDIAWIVSFAGKTDQRIFRISKCMWIGLGTADNLGIITGTCGNFPLSDVLRTLLYKPYHTDSTIHNSTKRSPLTILDIPVRQPVTSLYTPCIIQYVYIIQ